MNALRIIGYRSLPVQGRGQANGGAPHMRQYPHPIGAGHSLHLKAFGKAPGDADIRLHYIQTALLNRIAKSPTPLQLLAASDPHRQFLPKLPITLNLIWGHRLLIPVEVLVANPIADIKRSTHIIGAIRVDGEERLTTDRLAHRANILNIGFGAETDLHFHRSETRFNITTCLVPQRRYIVRHLLFKQPAGIGGNFLAARPADQLVHGQFKRLTRDIPQRDIHRAYRGDIAPAESVEPIPDLLAVKGILADHMRY